MKILGLLWSNLRSGVMTLRFPQRPPVGEGYRGLVHFEPSLCIGCAMCRFRCTSRAIAFRAGKTDFTWSYDPGQCTFCGRCVEGCKEHALSQDCACPPIYSRSGGLKQSWTLPRRPPPRKSPAESSVAEPAPTAAGGGS